MAGMIAHLALPFPPSVNRMWRSVQGRVLLSREGRKYREQAIVAMRMHGCPSFGKRRVRVHVQCYMPDNRRRDLDNLWKACGDAMQHAGMIDDDCQIDALSLVRSGIDREAPRLFVRIEEA